MNKKEKVLADFEEKIKSFTIELPNNDKEQKSNIQRIIDIEERLNNISLEVMKIKFIFDNLAKENLI